MFEGVLARIASHRRRHRAHPGGVLPSYRAGRHAAADRAAARAASGLIALTIAADQTTDCSTKSAQPTDIAGVDRNSGPHPCPGMRAGRVWTSIHGLNILAASSREVVAGAPLNLTIQAPRRHAERVCELRGSPCVPLPGGNPRDGYRAPFRIISSSITRRPIANN